MNKEIITKKLLQLKDYLDELEKLVLKFSKEEVLSDPSKRLATERLAQLIIDTMIDVNIQIIIDRNLAYEQTRSTFTMLGEIGVLPKEFANQIAPLAGLRNILVHRYEQLDKELFIRNLFKNYDNFKKYIAYINKFLEDSS
jgi:uncharacterized protein YutE (UPF0331/DUF86 family)